MVRPSKSLPSCASSVAQWQQRPRRLPGCRLFPMFWTHLNFARPCGEALESLRNHFCDIVTHLQERMCSVSIAPKPLLRPDESREVQPLQLQRLQQHSMVQELRKISHEAGLGEVAAFTSERATHDKRWWTFMKQDAAHEPECSHVC